MYSLRNISFPLVVLLCATLAGCGNEADDDTATPLSKAQFVKQANRICAEGEEESQRELDAYVKRNPPQSTPRVEFNTEIIKKAFLPSVDTVIEKLEALPPPTGDEEEIEAFLAADREAVETAEENEVPATLQVDPAFKEPGKLAREYGIERCAYR